MFTESLAGLQSHGIRQVELKEPEEAEGTECLSSEKLKKATATVPRLSGLHLVLITFKQNRGITGMSQPGVWTHLVTLNILRSLKALSTLIPNDAPGLIISQITSQMLPTITCRRGVGGGQRRVGRRR